LADRGLRQLGEPDLSTPVLRIVGVVVGSLVGAATTLAALRVGNLLVAVPLVAWGAAVVAASCCDAVTQRIPTALVRQAIVTTGVLLSTAFGLTAAWGALLLSVLAAAAAGGVALLCWRFADAGYGDVRLAVLGGLGLGYTSASGLLVALAVVVLIIAAQAVATLALGGARRMRFPLGPALATGFIVAATA
jgi:leader peptidase (prepilin peptidase) / N-methyltransferase